MIETLKQYSPTIGSTILLAVILMLGMCSSPAMADERPYMLFNVGVSEADFETCLEFIGDSPAMAEEQGLITEDPIVEEQDWENKFIRVTIPFIDATDARDGFARITCNDGKLYMGQFMYLDVAEGEGI